MNQEFLKKITNLKEQAKAYQAEIKAKNESFFKEAINFLFEGLPALENISWNQYTPYFNDGDTCEFGVNEIDVNTDEDGEGISRWRIEEKIKEFVFNPTAALAKRQQTLNKIEGIKSQISTAATTGKYKEAAKLQDELDRVEHELNNKVYSQEDVNKLLTLLEVKNQVHEVFKAFDEDFYKMMFGDHVKVTITRNGIEVEEYEHE